MHLYNFNFLLNACELFTDRIICVYLYVQGDFFFIMNQYIYVYTHRSPLSFSLRLMESGYLDGVSFISARLLIRCTKSLPHSIYNMYKRIIRKSVHICIVSYIQTLVYCLFMDPTQREGVTIYMS